MFGWPEGKSLPNHLQLQCHHGRLHLFLHGHGHGGGRGRVDIGVPLVGQEDYRVTATGDRQLVIAQGADSCIIGLMKKLRN